MTVRSVIVRVGLPPPKKPSIVASGVWKWYVYDTLTPIESIRGATLLRLQAGQASPPGNEEFDEIERLGIARRHGPGAGGVGPDVLQPLVIRSGGGVGLVDHDPGDVGDQDLRARRGEHPLDGGDDQGIDRLPAGRSGAAQRTATVIQGGSRPGTLASRVFDRQIVAEHEPELDHAQQDQQEDGQDQGELDEALTALPA